MVSLSLSFFFSLLFAVNISDSCVNVLCNFKMFVPETGKQKKKKVREREREKASVCVCVSYHIFYCLFVHLIESSKFAIDKLILLQIACIIKAKMFLLKPKGIIILPLFVFHCIV